MLASSSVAGAGVDSACTADRDGLELAVSSSFVVRDNDELYRPHKRQKVISPAHSPLRESTYSSSSHMPLLPLETIENS